MKNKLAQALGFVDDGYVAEAARFRRHGKRRLLAAVAAMMALVMVFRTPSIPVIVMAETVSRAEPAHGMDNPDAGEWVNRHLEDFYRDCARELLSGREDNMVWSPMNVYFALAMTAELSGGETQRQILDVLNTDDMEELRYETEGVWESVYHDDGKEISILANSLWLDREVTYDQQIMDFLAENYHASVYRGDLGSGRMNRALNAWVKNQTGGLLKSKVGSLRISDDSPLAIVSTVYFQSKWETPFELTSEGTFHGPGGDTQCSFMQHKLERMIYAWGKDFGAVRVDLENGNGLWLILPDEDKTVEDVLARGEYVELLDGNYERQRDFLVNLSVPQFDVSGEVDMKPVLEKIGLEAVFEPWNRDFNGAVQSELPVYLASVQQNARVAIDEEGVTGASYIVMEFGFGASMPPKDIVDFVVDRPFLFAVTNRQGAALFMGLVNQP